MFHTPADPTSPHQSRQALVKIADVFRLLAEPTRLAILQELKAGPKTVGTLVECLDSSQANVSKQLRILFDGGFLSRERDGVNVRYQIDDEMVFPLCDLVCERLNKRANERPLHYSI
ncbi:metalloregulator ArsR/SmtB family transcription factor [soil metagenome]